MPRVGWVSVCLFVAAGGCGRIAYGPLPTRDEGTLDAGSRDGAATEGDAGPRDTGPMGGDASIDPEVAAACNAVFGSVTAYQLCWTEGSACAFNAQIEPRTCANLCESLGSTCIGAYANSTGGDPTLACITTGTTDCAGRAFDDICICVLP